MRLPESLDVGADAMLVNHFSAAGIVHPDPFTLFSSPAVIRRGFSGVKARVRNSSTEIVSRGPMTIGTGSKPCCEL